MTDINKEMEQLAAVLGNGNIIPTVAECAAASAGITALLHRVEEVEDELADLQERYSNLSEIKRIAELHGISDIGFAALQGLSKDYETIEAERDALRAEMDAIKSQEPVVWRHDHGEENGGWEYYENASCDECQPLYARPVAPAQVPDGWKLVPVEPTRAMLDEAHKDLDRLAEQEKQG